MKTTAESVRRIIEQDPIAYEALGRDLLNAHAYARDIQEQVEEWCLKPVKINTIVTALSRLRAELSETSTHTTLVPEFTMDSVTVKLDVVEMAFQKGATAQSAAMWLKKQSKKLNDFFLTVDGNGESNFIFPQRFLEDIEKHIGQSSAINGCLKDLAVVTLSYTSHLTYEPNIGYALMRALALKHINVVEVVSTFSEVHFVLWSADISDAITAFSPFLKDNR